MYNVLTFLKFRAIITIIIVQYRSLLPINNIKTSTDENFAWGKMKKEMTHYLQSDIISLSNSQKKNINNLDR